MKMPIASRGKNHKIRYEKLISVSDLQSGLSRTLKEVDYTKQRMLVTRRDKIVAAIVPVSEDEFRDTVVIPQDLKDEAEKTRKG